MPVVLPPDAGFAIGLYADEGDLEDLRGVDAITSWSDLEGSNQRNSDRIQRALNWSDSRIQELLQNVYVFPLTNLTDNDKEVLRYWSAVFATYRLYIHRGQRDTGNSPLTMGRNAFTPELQSVLDDIWKYQNQTRRFSAPSKGSRVVVSQPMTVQRLFVVLDPL